MAYKPDIAERKQKAGIADLAQKVFMGRKRITMLKLKFDLI